MHTYIKQTGDNTATLSLSTENLIDIFQKMVENNNATVSESYPELATVLNPLIDAENWAEAYEEYKKFLITEQDYPLVNDKNEVVGELEFAAAFTEWAREKFSFIYDPMIDYGGDCIISTEPTFAYDWMATTATKGTPFSEAWAENANERASEGKNVYTDEVWEFIWEFIGGNVIVENIDYLLIKQGFVNLQRAFTITTRIEKQKATAEIQNFGDWMLE